MPVRRMTDEEAERIFGGGLIVFPSNLVAGLLAQKKQAEERKAADKALKSQAKEALAEEGLPASGSPAAHRREGLSTNVSNKKVRSAVRDCVPFKDSNLFAEILDNGIYAVWTYVPHGQQWPLFAKVDGGWYENEESYSVSTMRQRRNARPHPRTETIKVSCAELKKIIKK